MKLRAKFLVIMVGAILLLSFFILLINYTWVINTLRAELKEKGSIITRSLSANSENLILNNDLAGINELIERSQLAENSIEYVYFVDKKGETLADSFEGDVPTGLLKLFSAFSQRESINLINTDEGYIYDISYPILNGELGMVHLGISERNIKGIISRGSITIIIFVILLLIVHLIQNYLQINAAQLEHY